MLSNKVFGKLSTYIHSWKLLADTGVQQGQLLQLETSSRDTRVWQPVQHNIQEEGEVAGDGADIASCLLHGDTAEEDLLQGLLEDDRAVHAGSAVDAGSTPDDQQQQQQMQRQDRDAPVLLDDGMQVEAAADDFAGQEDSYRDLHAAPSGGSELLPGDDDAPTTAGGAGSGVGQALLASHSLYRLVLKAPALEVHFHVKVFYNYPLCPPVFAVTKMLDASQRGDPVLMTDVNEVLKLQQQVNTSRCQPGPQRLNRELVARRAAVHSIKAVTNVHKPCCTHV